MFKTAYLMLSDRADAEDVLQEVFLQVHRRLTTYDARKGAFTTWLSRITVNRCLNRRRSAHPTALLDGAGAAVAVSQHPEADLADADELFQALQRLSDKLRAVGVLRYYHDLSYEEIARVLDCPTGTVRSRLSAALHELRRHLTTTDSGTLASVLPTEGTTR